MKKKLGIFAGFLAGILSFARLGYKIGYGKGFSEACDECTKLLKDFDDNLRKKYPHLYEEES